LLCYFIKLLLVYQGKIGFFGKKRLTPNQPVYLLYAAFIAASVRSGEEGSCT